MTGTSVIIVESDPARRRTLRLLVRAATAVDVDTFECYDKAVSRTRLDDAAILLCRWEDGGERLIRRRVDRLDGNSATLGPHILVLTHEVTSGRIAAARQAGNTELIPDQPLNLNALRNRILLILEGPARLGVRLCRSGPALRTALETLPALRRRMAA